MFSFQGMDKGEIIVALGKLYRRQVYIAAAVVVIVALLMKPAMTGVGSGVAWSLLDNLLLVTSALKGLNRMSEKELKSRTVKNFVKRLVLALVMLYLAYRYNAGIVWMLIAFTVMHLALVLNLLIFTGRKEQKRVS
ncbi:MAG: hypothetical protein J5915_01780 [Acidaminococcaceae bacterium]|nr:hypothetical protein [Acidaminococcaceae bacterium]MBO6265183.1 hypothetical protein [Acidaminococcaceae bacterium]MBQ5343644.1 hypothetical protein [Acidaminococcaceae bacterium]MBQ7418446.1 hypothetical protein [Acidaminococcaceae bacterium]MBQ8491560.1 hypothetical protein [Acidaminococcaceae bacterium]